MLGDLISQEFMYRNDRRRVLSDDLDASTVGGLAVRVADRRLELLHRGDTRRHLAVRGEWCVEIACGELRRNVAQMCPNRVEVLDIDGVTDLDFDSTSRWLEQKVVRYAILVKAHRGRAALF